MMNTAINLAGLSKMVLVEMTRELFGAVGDYARLDKQHFVDMVAKCDEEQISAAFEAVRAKNPGAVPVQTGPVVSPVAPVRTAAPSGAADMLAEALRQLVPQAPIDEAAVRRMIADNMRDFSSAVVDMVAQQINAAIANVQPKVQTQTVVLHANGTQQPITGHTHKAFARIMQGAALRQNILLVGPAGCGKTKVAHQVSEGLSLPFASLSCSAGMSESQLLGWLLPVGENGRFEYVSSDFVHAYEHGGVFLLDELDAADENVLLVINQALANGAFYLPQRRSNPKVTRHPDFVLIAAANTFGHGADMMYSGRNKLDGATLDRFRANIVPMDYDADLESALVSKDVLTWGRAIRSAISEKKLRRVMSTRAMLDFTAQQSAGLTVGDWEKSYFADWTRDELTKIGR